MTEAGSTSSVGPRQSRRPYQTPVGAALSAGNQRWMSGRGSCSVAQGFPQGGDVGREGASNPGALVIGQSHRSMLTLAAASGQRVNPGTEGDRALSPESAEADRRRREIGAQIVMRLEY